MTGRKGRPKGLPKTGGRKKGTPNRRTQLGGDDTLHRLVEAMEDPGRMMAELDELHGKDFFRVYFDAQAFLRPKYSNIAFEGNVSVGNEVADKLREMAEL